MGMFAIAWWMLGGVASGQRFDAFKLPKGFEAFKEPKKAAELQRAAGQLVTTKDMAKLDAQIPGMAKFYLETYIPWKITQRESLPELTDTIENLLKDLERAQRSESAGLRTLLAGTFIGMKKVAEGNYMPAARVNAINALSRIHARPLDIANGRPPVPLSYSFPVLMKLYADEAQVDGVRAAALHGLHHYAGLAFPIMKPEEKKRLVDEMKKLLESKPPASRDPAAHAYLQRFAVDILDLFRNPNDGALGTQLISISTTEEAPDVIALYSASKLGVFDKGLQGPAKDPAPIVKKWSLRAFQNVESEIARIAALQRPTPAMQQPPNPKDFLQKSVDKKKKKAPGPPRGAMGMDSGMGMDPGMDMGMEMGMEMGMDMGMMGMGMGMGGMAPVAKPQPPEVDISRRHLTHVLQQLLRGATGSRSGQADTPSGLLAAADQPNQAALKTWVETISRVLEALNDDLLDTQEKWVEVLQEQRLVLGNLAGLEVQMPEPEDADDRGSGLPGLPGLTGFGVPAQPEPEAEAAPAGLPGLPGT